MNFQSKDHANKTYRRKDGHTRAVSKVNLYFHECVNYYESVFRIINLVAVQTSLNLRLIQIYQYYRRVPPSSRPSALRTERQNNQRETR